MSEDHRDAKRNRWIWEGSGAAKRGSELEKGTTKNQRDGTAHNSSWSDIFCGSPTNPLFRAQQDTRRLDADIVRHCCGSSDGSDDGGAHRLCRRTFHSDGADNHTLRGWLGLRVNSFAQVGKAECSALEQFLCHIGLGSGLDYALWVRLFAYGIGCYGLHMRWHIVGSGYTFAWHD